MERRFDVKGSLQIAAIFVITLWTILSPLSGMTLDRSGTWEVYFSPHGGCTKAIIRELNNAKSSILVQAYSFTSAPIAKALLDAHKRGVKVEVILDKSQKTERYSSATFLLNSGIPVKIDAQHAIAHAFDEMVHLDLVRENAPPFDFVKVVEEYAGLLHDYDIRECWGDRYAFASLESQLRRHRIALSQSKANATEFYLKLKALLQAGAVILLDDKKLVAQLKRLELQMLHSGAERIDHPKNANDDLASAAAGAIYHVCKAMESRQPVPAFILQRHEHPDLQCEKESAAKEELENCEKEMMEYIADGSRLGIPVKPDRNISQ